MKVQVHDQRQLRSVRGNMIVFLGLLIVLTALKEIFFHRNFRRPVYMPVYKERQKNAIPGVSEGMNNRWKWQFRFLARLITLDLFQLFG